MGSRRGEISRRDPRSEQGGPSGPPFFVGAHTRRRVADRLPGTPARTHVAAGLAALVAAVAAAGARAGDPAPSGAADAPAAVVVLVASDTARLQALDCADGHETGSFPLPAPARSIALAPQGDAAFVAAGGQLLRLRLPSLAADAHSALAAGLASLAASGGTDGIVLAAGSGRTPLSARDPATLDPLHEYRLDDDRRASVSSFVDRPQRSRFVVAFSDLDEIWEIDYRRDAPPVLRGLVHDYRMREAVELPGRFTPRTFTVSGPTRSLVAGSAAHEVLRIDATGAPGLLNLDVRREIERPQVGTLPAPERIAGWHGTRSRGWVLADEGASALRVLDAATAKLVEPVPVDGEVLAVAALDDGAVLLALDRAGRVALARADVEARRVRHVAEAAQAGERPHRFVRGTGGCAALVDARGRWIAGLRQGTRAAAPDRGS